MNRPAAGRLVLAETVRPHDRMTASAVNPCASRLQMMAAYSQAISPRLGDVPGVLPDAARPCHCGSRSVLRPLWAEEATHRAYSMLILAAQLRRTPGVGLEADVTSRLDRGIANDLAGLFRTLDFTKDEEELPCSSVLRGVIRNLVALSGSGARRIVIRTDIASLLLPAYRRRALVLAASELVVNALRHGFTGKRDGQIEVTLRAVGTAHACLTVVDDGVGFGKCRPRGQHGIAGGLADLLEADLVYRQVGSTGTNAEIVFPTYRRISAVGPERLTTLDRRPSAIRDYAPELRRSAAA